MNINTDDLPKESGDYRLVDDCGTIKWMKIEHIAYEESFTSYTAMGLFIGGGIILMVCGLPLLLIALVLDGLMTQLGKVKGSENGG